MDPSLILEGSWEFAVAVFEFILYVAAATGLTFLLMSVLKTLGRTIDEIFSWVWVNLGFYESSITSSKGVSRAISTHPDVTFSEMAMDSAILAAGQNLGLWSVAAVFIWLALIKRNSIAYTGASVESLPSYVRGTSNTTEAILNQWNAFLNTIKGTVINDALLLAGFVVAVDTGVKDLSVDFNNWRNNFNPRDHALAALIALSLSILGVGISEIPSLIKNLEDNQNKEKTQISGLAGVVNGHSADIDTVNKVTIPAVVSAEQTDVRNLQANINTVSTNAMASIGLINSVSIPGINVRLSRDENTTAGLPDLIMGNVARNFIGNDVINQNWLLDRVGVNPAAVSDVVGLVSEGDLTAAERAAIDVPAAVPWAVPFVLSFPLLLEKGYAEVATWGPEFLSRWAGRTGIQPWDC